MIPGANLFGLAAGLIATQAVEHYACTGQTVASNGDVNATYAAGVTIYASVQSTESQLINDLGLDSSRNYRTFYSASAMRGPARDRAGDRLEFAGVLYYVEKELNWREVDGWCGVVAVQTLSNAERKPIRTGPQYE